MGSLLFDFLNDSVLFDDGRLDTHFSGVDNNRLTRELVGYRDHVVTNMAGIIDEARAGKGTLSVLGNAQLSTVPELTKAAFYFDTVIVTDPLFSLTPPPPEVAKFAIGMSGADTPWQLDRERIVAAVGLMKSLRLAVVTGYVRFMPDLRGRIAHEVPVMKSDDLFASLLPQEIRDLYYKAVQIDSIERIGTTNAVRFGPLSPDTSEIGIRFEDNEGARSGPMWGYRFMETDRVHSDDPSKVKLRMRQVPAGTAVDNWVAQSVNLAAANHFTDLEGRTGRALDLGAGFLVNSKLEQSVLGGRRREDINTFGGDCIVNLDVPVLTGVPLDDILRIRADDGMAFANFRAALQGKLRALRTEQDPAKTRAGVEDAVHELGEIQRIQIARNMQSLKKKALFDVALAVGSLAASPASPWTLAGALAAVVKGREHYVNYRSQSDNPAFFLWRVKGASQ